MFSKKVYYFLTVRFIHIIIFTAVLCLSGHFAAAADCTTTANNTWSCGTPTSTDDLYVIHQVLIPGDFSSNASIVIENGGHLEIEGDFLGNDCNVIIKNEGTLKVNGLVNIGSQCTVNVEGELKVGNSLALESGASMEIRGSTDINGNVTIQYNSRIRLKQNSILFVGGSFTNQSDDTEIDGDLTIVNGLYNSGTITGVGLMSFQTCTSTGLINDMTPEDYCTASPLNLLETHCSSTDTEAPQFSFNLEDITLFTTANDCQARAYWDFPVVSDNCSIDQIDSTHSSGQLFDVGSSKITYSAIDKAGNEATMSFNVIVKDTISPVITEVPSFISVDAELETCSVPVTWKLPVASDNCSAILTSDYNSGDYFPIGTTQVTYQAVDPSGNKTQVKFEVKVKNPHIPVFKGCPDDIIVYADETSCSKEVFWTEPEVSGCGIEIVQSHIPGDLFAAGIHSVTYKATDVSGNVANCEFVVQVIDTIAPKFVPCPSTYTLVSTDSTSETFVVSWVVPEVVDNCSSVSLSSNYQPNDIFPTGNTEVVYTATDKYNNKAVCTFEVSTKINKAPVVEDLVFDADAGEFLYICLNAEDPDNDGIFLDSIAYNPNDAIIEEVDSISLCFRYSSAIDFDGADSIKVFVVDNGILPLKGLGNVYLHVKSDRTIKVASAITSNEDGINDKWIISNINFYPGNSVHVYDPYGGLVYQTTGYDNQDVVWKGKNTEGKYVPQGTYFFAINPGNNLEQITGAVEVIR